MPEANSLEKFQKELDLILKNNISDLKNAETEDSELLLLAQKMKQIDYSVESEVKQSLKELLLKKIRETEGSNTDGELSDEELGCAAGGLQDFPVDDDPQK